MQVNARKTTGFLRETSPSDARYTLSRLSSFFNLTNRRGDDGRYSKRIPKRNNDIQMQKRKNKNKEERRQEKKKKEEMKK